MYYSMYSLSIDVCTYIFLINMSLQHLVHTFSLTGRPLRTTATAPEPFDDSCFLQRSICSPGRTHRMGPSSLLEGWLEFMEESSPQGNVMFIKVLDANVLSTSS